MQVISGLRTNRFTKKEKKKNTEQNKMSKHIYPCMPEDAHISHFNTSEMLTSTKYFCTKFRTVALNCPNSTISRNQCMTELNTNKSREHLFYLTLTGNQFVKLFSPFYKY